MERGRMRMRAEARTRTDSETETQRDPEGSSRDIEVADKIPTTSQSMITIFTLSGPHSLDSQCKNANEQKISLSKMIFYNLN